MKTLLLWFLGVFCFFNVAAQCPLGSIPSVQELVTNGNFSSGNTGFSSSYANYSGGTLNEGHYAVNTNAQNVHPNFTGRDHTTGTGNFMIINGAAIANIPVWCQTISVRPNTVYLFSAWVSSVVASNPATLQFSINGINLGTTFNAPPVVNTWSQFFISWNSGTDTSASICVVNQNTVALGNDFGLDDISFVECTCNLIADAGPDKTFCPGDSIQLIARPDSFNYAWSTGSTSQILFVNSPGIYYVIASSGFCSDSDSVSVTYIQAPAPVITGDSLICNGGSAIIDAGPNYTSYHWSTGDTNQIISVDTPGNYFVTVTNDSGCTGIDTVNLLPRNISLPVISGDSVFCLGDSTNLDAGTGFESYLWSNGDSSQTISVNESGYFSVEVSDSGCTANDSIYITTLHAKIPVILGDTIFCENDSTILTVSGTFQNVTWNTGTAGYSIYVDQPGIYSVVTLDNNGCSSSAQKNVIESPNPELIIDSQKECHGLDVTFTLTGNNINTFTWDYGDGTTDYNLSPVTHRFSKPDTFTISLQVISSHGCITDTLFELPVDTLSDVRANIFLSTNTVLLDEPFYFQTEQAGQNIFNWDFGDGNQSDKEDPVYTYSIPGSYVVTLTVTNPMGCQAVDKTSVDIAAVFIANSFTPNGDGLNDVFVVSVTSNLNNFSLEIFNRQGNKIFNSESPAIGWDGNENGILAPEGVYEYIVEIKSDTGVLFQKVGKVTLIR